MSNRGGFGASNKGKKAEKGNANQGKAAAKKPIPTHRSPSELRRLLHDKLEWNDDTSSLNLTLLLCADETTPVEAELILISSASVESIVRYVRADLMDAKKRVDNGEDEREERSDIRKREDVIKFDPISKTHKCKILNQIARCVQNAWCGLLFVPSYQLIQATAFIRALNPKPLESHYVDGYISRLACLEDLFFALRSSRGLIHIEPPLALTIWSSMREEDMADLSDYSELTCLSLIATLNEPSNKMTPLLEYVAWETINDRGMPMAMGCDGWAG